MIENQNQWTPDKMTEKNKIECRKYLPGRMPNGIPGQIPHQMPDRIR
jgi:hypothetical protein